MLTDFEGQILGASNPQNLPLFPPTTNPPGMVGISTGGGR